MEGRHAALAKARAAAVKAARLRRMAKLHDAIVETGKRYPKCRCDINPETTLATIRALGGGCTMPSHACPRLDAIRRRTDDWVEQS